MSDHRLNPFPLDRIVCGNRVFDLNSFFNEPAGPRRRPFPWASIMRDIPSYARVHNIYPEFQRFTSGDHDLYRYRPSTTVVRSGSPNTGGGGGVVNINNRDVTEIPVVHLLGSSSSTLNSINSPWSTSSDTSSLSRDRDRDGIGGRVSTTSTSSINTQGSLRTDSEAEVDALTNTLIRKLDLVTDKDLSHLNNHQQSSLPLTTTTPTTTSAAAAAAAAAASAAARPPTTLLLSPTESSSSTATTLGGGVGGSVGDLNELNDESTMPNCYRCRRSLDPRSKTAIRGLALRAWFHRNCFHCYRCDCTLSPDDYVHVTGRVLCPNCAATALERCHGCEQVIRARLIRGLGRAYHPQCFTCCVCGCCLDGRPFTCDVHDRVLCLEDFHRRYAPRCAACGLPITPTTGSQETRRVVTKNLNYHLDCFAARRADQAV